MFSKFLNLNPEKKERILNAALKEFAQKGYQNASTNEIVKEAEISKGLLFHYFINKKELYLFLYDYFMKIFMEEIHAKVNWNENDIFIRFRNIALLKYDLFQKYPKLFDFFKTIYKENSEEVKVDLELRQKELLSKGYKDLFSDIDLSKFKDGIDVDKAVKIIFWTMEGFANSKQDAVDTLQLEDMDLEEITSEMDLYSEILRQSFYKIG